MVKKSSNLPTSTRKLIVEAALRGDQQKDIAKQFNCTQGAVSKILKKHRASKRYVDYPRTGRPRKTTPHLDRVITRTSKQDPKKNAVDISKEIAEDHGVKISAKTVGRRLDALGLHARAPVKKPYVSPKNRMRRIEFANKYQNWTTKDWSNVVWTDESKFNLFGSDGRRYIRRPNGKKFDPRYTNPTMKHGGGSVMVYGAFSANGVGPIVRVNGNMTSETYRDILKMTTVPWAKQYMKRGWILQADNDPKHVSKVTKQWMSNNRIQCLFWPSQSPDANPIEHLWHEVEKRLRNCKPKNGDELFTMIENEWNNLPKSLLFDLVASMPRRLKAIRDAKGFPTKY